MQINLSRLEIGIYALVFLLLLGLCLVPRSGADKGAKAKTRPPCSRKQAALYIRDLQEIARREELRQWMDDSLASRQAAWLLAKANYALASSKRIGGGDLKKEVAALLLIEDSWKMLIRAAAQSRLGRPDIEEEKGARLRAFLSEIDQSFQTYSISLPAAYDPDVKWPLLVSMHGHGWYAPFQGHPAPSYRGVFCLSPQGRGATDYKDIGELDVLQAIAEVQKDFNIDPNRIYLSGSSMGGTGSFHLGVHYADRFAAIFPIVGNADNRAWEQRWGWNNHFPGRNTELRGFLQESHNARAYAKNLFNLPAYVVAGSADTVVPPEHSRFVVQELRQAGYNVEYREYPGVGHGGFPAEALSAGMAWTCSWQRNPFPDKIFWRCAQLKHGKAYWMRMEQFSRPLEFAQFEAEFVKKNRIKIKTQNLSCFSLQFPKCLFDHTKPIFLYINDELLLMPPNYHRGENAWHRLRHDHIHGWDWESSLPVPELFKGRNLEGPMQEILLSPFMLVVGSNSPNPAMNQAWLEEARYFQREWKRRNNVTCPMVMDKDFKPEMMGKRNLLLFGGPDDNSVSALFADNLPIAEIFAPLRHRGLDLAAPDIGYQLLYPAGALAPNRMLCVLGANAPEAAWQQWGRFGNWFNWGVYDSKKYYDFAIFDAHSSSPETMLLNGWFDCHWSLADAVLHFGDPTLRADSAAFKYPRYASVDEAVPAAVLYLAELKPGAIDQMRGALFVGGSFYGENTGEYDLGMRAPACMEYDLQGRYYGFTSEAELHNPYETKLGNLRRKGEKVRFSVFADGKKVAESILDWEKPKARLTAVLPGAKKLRLECMPAGGPSWLHAGAVWKAPQLLPSKDTPTTEPLCRILETESGKLQE
ncbi:MAG: prolyl oligopeptidase family serine peptidase [Oligosphaeraceae bacterium]|nr:prolyl oligopeptidase family serine peptidase [Oligosphaeraceae bacterium]